MFQEKPPLILLGAGASVSAGIPTAINMTDEMVKFCEEEEREQYKKALWAIIGALQMGLGQESVSKGVDIERVLNAANLLSKRFNLEFTPFVAAWHPIVEDLEQRWLISEQKKYFGVQVPRVTNRGGVSVDPQSVNHAFEELVGSLEDKLFGYMSQRPDGALFKGLMQFLTGKLVDLTYKSEYKEEVLGYLKPLVECGHNNLITIATLNYDNTIERCAENQAVIYQTGLESWAKTGEFAELNKGVDLIKLHGSVKWYRGSARDYSNSLGLSHNPLIEASDDDMKSIIQQIKKDGYTEGAGKQLGVIFGGHNKLTAEGPFIDLLYKFRKCLAKSSELIVIGYSFRDEHVNHCITQWGDNNEKKMIIIDPQEKFLEDNIHLYGLRQNFGNRV